MGSETTLFVPPSKQTPSTRTDTPTGSPRTPATPSPRSPRTCSICSLPGHNKRTCTAFTSKTLLAAYRQAHQDARQAHLLAVRERHPYTASLTDEQLLALLQEGNSHAQSMRGRGGRILETSVEAFLTRNHIPYKPQVPIKNGIVVKGKKGNKVLDIVIGTPVVGDSITQFIVLSLKTSSRERPSEDDWTYTYVPKLYLYASLEADYPPPEKFGESEVRKLVCATPKTDDTRRFKLGFEHLLEEIRRV